jgi:hypothetical protein
MESNVLTVLEYLRFVPGNEGTAYVTFSEEASVEGGDVPDIFRLSIEL